jgi:tRNA-binding protein
MLYHSTIRTARCSAPPVTDGMTKEPTTHHYHTMTTPLEAFGILDMRIGTVLSAVLFTEARVPAIKLEIDFGPELGVKRSSAQLTKRYEPAALVGRQVVAAVNLGVRRIAGFASEVLVLGGVPEKGDVILLALDVPVPNGTKVA